MYSDLTRTPVRIDLVSLDARARERFETLFRERGQGAYLVVNSTVAEVAIIDLDAADGQMHWHRYCEQFPNRPVILLSETKPHLERGEKHLRKPLHIDALIGVLEEIRQRLEGRNGKGDSDSKGEATDTLDPGTIRITDRGLLGALQTPLRGGESLMVGPDPQAGAKSGRRFDNACAEPRNDLFDSAEDAHERTHRYQQPLPHRLVANDLESQQSPDRLANSAPLDPDGRELPEQPDPDEHTQRIRVQGELQRPVTMLCVRTRLLGMLQSALAQLPASEGTLELTLPGGWLVLQAATRRIHTSFTDQQLSRLAKRTIASNQVHIRAYGSTWLAPADSAGKPLAASESLEAVLWKLALWTYRGCLPSDTNLEQRVYLRHWPNLTRLHPVPNAMRIAALWCEQPMTLGFTAKALAVPQRHVFDFYCASHAIGLAGQARRETDYLFQEDSNRPRARRRLVSDMMKRLRSIGNS